MKNRLVSVSSTLERIDVTRSTSFPTSAELTIESLWSEPTPRFFSPSPTSAT